MRRFRVEKIGTGIMAAWFLLLANVNLSASQLSETTAENDSVQSYLQQEALNNSLDSFALFLKTVGLVLCFSVALYLFLRWYRKSMYGKNFNKHSSEMRLLGAMNIGPKKSICMVNVLEHVLVLGLTENDMNLLLDIPQDQINQPLKESLLENDKEHSQNFGKILNNWMKKNTA